MFQLNKTREELEEIIGSFIWDFKVGDNILYNLKVLFHLVEDCNLSTPYKKPLTIIAFSITEGVMADFMYRLHQGTHHFPKSVSKKEAIKDRLTKETKEKTTLIDGEKKSYRSLKNFGFSEMLEIYKEFKFLGEDEEIYKTLLYLSRFRNRVHILNYFKNFEKDETNTFSTKRTQLTLDTMLCVINYFGEKYKRPWT